MSTLTIVSITPEPLDVIAFLTTAPGERAPSEQQLPIYAGTVHGLPAAVSALVIASDLQGVVVVNGQDRLLGEVVVDYLELLYARHFPTVSPARTLALLCGDLYADKGKRGASGTPLRVWQRFSAYLGSTVGIAGNHDDFGLDLRVVQALANTHLLVQGTVHAQGLRVSGQSGIMGRPDKNFRFPEATYLQGVTKLLRELPDLLLTHLSPHLAEQGLLGEPKLTALLTQAAPTLVLCGHSHWPTPYPQVLANGTQVLNADTKVFILTRA